MKEGWKYIELKSICAVQNGYAFDSKKFNDASIGLPLVRIRDIKRGYSLTYTDESCQSEFFVENGDILIGMDGDFNVGIWNGGRAYLNQRVCKLIPTNKVSSRFLYYFIPKTLEAINAKTAFSTVKHLSSKQVNAIQIPDLPLSEQQRIVAYLDAAFAKIDALKAKAKENLDNAQALFQAALTEMMTPKEGGVGKTLVDEFKLRSGENLTAKQQCAGIYPVYGGNGIAGYHNDYNLSGENLLIGRVGAQCGNIHFPKGKIWVTDNAFIVNKISDLWLKDFLYYELISLNLNQYAAQAAQPVISNKSMKDVKIFLPSLAEQKKVAKTLDSIKSTVENLHSNFTTLSSDCDTLKQSLLRQVFE